MDDVQIPQVASLGEGWHFFGEGRSGALHDPQLGQPTAQLARRNVIPTSNQEPVITPQLSYASFVSREVPLPALSAAPSGAVSIGILRSTASAPRTPVFVLKSGMVLSVGNFSYRDGRITYSLASGGSGVISTDEIDWSTTTRVNSQRGVRLTLRSGHQNPGTPGL
jgi:hypothetical protein